MTSGTRDTIVDAVTASGVTVGQFGATVLVLRTLRGLSLKQVARGARIPVKNLVELEAGKWRPPDAVLLEVLAILEVDLPHFLVALREVKFIEDLVESDRTTRAPGKPILILGDGMSLPKGTAKGGSGDGDGDGNGEPN